VTAVAKVTQSGAVACVQFVWGLLLLGKGALNVQEGYNGKRSVSRNLSSAKPDSWSYKWSHILPIFFLTHLIILRCLIFVPNRLVQDVKRRVCILEVSGLNLHMDTGYLNRGLFSVFEDKRWNIIAIRPRPLHCTLIIIIIFINCNWVVTRWQWLFYMYTKYEIGY